MKRRLLFSNYDSLRNPFYGGGGARAIHEIGRRLAVRHEVRVIAGAYPGCEDHVVDGVRYEHLGRERAGGKLGQLWYQLALPKRSRQGDFEIWVESLTPPFSTACLQRFTSRPVVALTQVLAGEGMSRKYRLPFASLERWGLKTYRYAIALSEHLKRRILETNPVARIEVIPNGVGRSLIDLELDRREKHILFLGRLDVRQKGLDTLLDAFAGVAGNSSIPLVVAGSGADRDERWLRRRIRFLGLDDRVTLAGRVEGDEKQALLRQAYCLAMPSRFEASPLVMLEAFCYRLPTVIGDIPELAGVPSSCCVRVPPWDVTGLSRELLRLLTDPKRRVAMGRAAKEYVRRFDWDDLARRYEEFFEKIPRRG